tara:strand:- start:3672 stop:3848 length:177 start_codon:yes stop_codon:yes gene_type:complete
MKKDLENIYTGLLFGLFLYFVGAINFESYFSYPVIFAVGIIIIFPIFNIIRRKINKSS